LCFHSLPDKDKTFQFSIYHPSICFYLVSVIINLSSFRHLVTISISLGQNEKGSSIEKNDPRFFTDLDLHQIADTVHRNRGNSTNTNTYTHLIMPNSTRSRTVASRATKPSTEDSSNNDKSPSPSEGEASEAAASSQQRYASAPSTPETVRHVNSASSKAGESQTMFSSPTFKVRPQRLLIDKCCRVMCYLVMMLVATSRALSLVKFFTCLPSNITSGGRECKERTTCY